MYPKVGEDGRVRSRGVMIAVGINRDDYREILGMMVPDTESECRKSWFVSTPKDQGLHGGDIIVSDQQRLGKSN